jgi:hypothetical protein
VHLLGLMSTCSGSPWVRDRRSRRDLYHAALEVRASGERVVIEMTPAWGASHVAEGAVASGPVGLQLLGRSRLFRYEVHCWRDGVSPDRSFAVGGPHRLTEDEPVARRVLELAPSFPTAVWGRDEFDAGDMWNTNSLIAWVLVRRRLRAKSGSGSQPPGGEGHDRDDGHDHGAEGERKGQSRGDGPGGSTSADDPRTWRLAHPCNGHASDMAQRQNPLLANESAPQRTIRT